jgi:hypothetical protein
MEMPKHIKYLSILFFLNAAIAGFVGGLSFFSMVHTTLNRGDSINDLNSVVSRIIFDFGLSILFTSLAIIMLIFLGISLRKLRPWARTVTLVYSMLTIFLGLLNLLTGENNLSYQFFIQVYAAWVLLRPDVRVAFGVIRKNDPLQNGPN